MTKEDRIDEKEFVFRLKPSCPGVLCKTFKVNDKFHPAYPWRYSISGVDDGA